MDMVLYAGVRRRPARKPDGLQEDRGHVRTKAQPAVAVRNARRKWRMIFASSLVMTRRAAVPHNVHFVSGALRARVRTDGITAMAACFALGALIEDLANPTVVLGGHTYD